MLTRSDWLPIGSVVTLVGGSRPVMIAGYMALDGSTGRYCDYIGVAYPEGRRNPREGYFFDRELIEEIHQVGLLDAEGCAFQAALDKGGAAFERIRGGSQEAGRVGCDER